MFDLPPYLVPAALSSLALVLIYLYNKRRHGNALSSGPINLYDEISGAIVVPARVIPEAELPSYNGEGVTKEIFVAIKGIVYDVTAKRGTYGRGGSYSVFAAKDASRALGMSSMSPNDCSSDYSDLNEKQMKTLNDWELFFQKRYRVIGRTEKYKEPAKVEEKKEQ